MRRRARFHAVSAARAIALAVVVGAGGALVGAVPGTAPDVAAASRGFRMDLARSGDFVPQTNFVQCVGASMQMMLNILGPKDDRTARTQVRLQNLARNLSGPTPEGFERN